jgi:predicted metal-binding membrane protein
MRIRERILILAALLVLTIVSWAILIQQSAVPSEQMGMNASLFITLWVLMMAAMMFPAAAPMVMAFAQVQASKRERGQLFVPTWIFVGAYMVVWTLFGALAWAVAAGVEAAAHQAMWLMENTARLSGGMFILAGLYQFSPLKHACLAKCRTPLNFILNAWRDGYGGAFRMGLEHGLYCLGCCWLLFAILFPLGLMNVAAMAAITLLIFAEKSLPMGIRISQLAAAALMIYGVWVMFVPAALPMM